MFNSIKFLLKKIKLVKNFKQLSWLRMTFYKMTNKHRLSDNQIQLSEQVLEDFTKVPPKKIMRLYDPSGLIVTITTKGRISFSSRLMLNGERRQSVIGYYPAITLQEARNICADIKHQTQSRRIFKSVPTVRALFLDFQSRSDYRPNTVKNNMSVYRRYINPLFGDLLIVQINNLVISEKLKLIESEKRKKLVLMYLNQVLDFAVLMGFIPSNPAVNLWKLLYKKDNRKIKKEHRQSISAKEVGILNPLFVPVNNGVVPYEQSQLAVAFLLLSLCRLNEVLSMKWEYIDLKNNIITFPESVMKAGREQRIPLTIQMRVILSRQKELNGESKSEYVFPNLGQIKSEKSHRKTRDGKTGRVVKGKLQKKEQEFLYHQSPRPIYKLFARCNLKGKIVPHGFRALGRTWMEAQNIKRPVAEMCLAHSIKTATEAAYNRTDYLEERKKTLKHWNNYLCTQLDAMAEICQNKKD